MRICDAPISIRKVTHSGADLPIDTGAEVRDRLRHQENKRPDHGGLPEVRRLLLIQFMLSIDVSETCCFPKGICFACHHFERKVSSVHPLAFPQRKPKLTDRWQARRRG